MKRMSRPILSLLAALALAVPTAALADPISFGSGWTEQRFSMLSSNDFALNGNSLGVRSDGTVSLLWARLPERLWGNRAASWNWAVEQSVPATDLTRKGGDDRNLSLYFLFLPDAAAEAAKGSGVRALMNNAEVRVLMYVWGGAHARGDILPTPYLGARGRTVVRRAAGTGSASEQVDLERDYRAAFGEAPENLVGIAVSADSDDTDSEISARLSGLRID